MKKIEEIKNKIKYCKDVKQWQQLKEGYQSELIINQS